MNIISNFFVFSGAHLSITATLVIFLIYSKTISSEKKRIFFILLALNFLFLVSDCVDLSIKFADEASITLPRDARIRNVAVGISYALKTLILYFSFISSFNLTRKTRIILFIPASINVFLSISSIWTRWVFYIDDRNYFFGTQLKPLYMTIIFSYFVIFSIMLLCRIKTMRRPQFVISALMLLLPLAYTIISLFISDSRINLLSLSIILSIMLYFVRDFIDKNDEIIRLKDEEIRNKQISLMISQIQPHFLYNTLSAIRDMCHTEPLLAEQTLVDFSFYLRNNLDFGNNTNPMITVEKELEHTRLYTNIEKTRFEYITVVFDINDGGYSIPFLTIQPLVENAIKHGIRGLKNGCVWIILNKEVDSCGNEIHKIVIKDNGVGKVSTDDTKKQIGIPNVRSRIESLCNGTFDIEFSPNGTTVTITLPVKMS